MSDTLFNQFANPDNLRKAFIYVQDEIKQSTLPLDPFWTPGIKAIERLNDAFFNSLSKLLLDDHYKPDDIYFFYQHKENFSIRKLALLTAVDRVVYQAILNPKIIGLQLSDKSIFFSRYPSVTSSGKSYLEHYKKPYQSYWDFQKYFYEKNGMVVRGEYDIHCFFDNISHKALFEQLEKDEIGSEKLRLFLKNLLTKWFPGGRGIPQGSQVSSVIANYYLNSVDKIEYKMPAKKVDYVRYMDDISIMAQDEKTLLSWVEKLTYRLNDLGLVLNSKTKNEIITGSDYFDGKGIAPYQPFHDEEEAPFFSQVIDETPAIIGRISRQKKVSRSELSKLKYYLKASPDYSLAKEILLLYPELPSFADFIAKYIQPIGNETWVQVLILKLLSEKHLFRWQKLWLAKLLLIEKLKGSPKYFEVDFRKSSLWELRSMAWMAESLAGEGIDFQTLCELVESAENQFERSIYLSLIPPIMNKDTFKLASDYFNNNSLEIQTIVKSVFVSGKEDKQVKDYARDGSLFSVSPNKGVVTTALNDSILGDDLQAILGFSHKTTQPKRRFVFELKLVGQEILMMGSILNGQSYPAFNSNRTSAFRRVVKTLLTLHMGKANEIIEHYQYSAIKDTHIADSKKDEVESVDLVKDKRLLNPLCAEFFDLLVEQGQNKALSIISFRSAIDEKAFDLLDTQRQKKIASLAKEILDSVNS